MASPFWFSIGLAILLGVGHFLGEEINELLETNIWIASASAGVTVSYVFLQLLPEFQQGVSILGVNIFVFGMAGFSIMHLIEVSIYHHEIDVEDLRKDFREVHTASLFIYYLALGVIIQTLSRRSLVEAVLFFSPVMLHTVLSSLSLKELHEDVMNVGWIKVLLGSSSALGVILASIIEIKPLYFHAILGLIVGMFLYVAISDSISLREKGHPSAFVLGLVFYSGLIIVLRSLLL